MGDGKYGTSKDGTFGTAFIGNRAGTNNARVHTGFLGTQLGQGDNGESYTAMAWIRWDGSRSGSSDHMVFGANDGEGNNAMLHHGIRDDSVNNMHFGGWGGSQDISDAGSVAAGFNERSNFEFIELMNISSASIDLTNVRFTSGITFAFVDSEIGFILPPAGRVILINNRAAFEMRDTGVPAANIAGTYSGNLSNDGEQLILLANDNSIIRNFAYNDQAPWPDSSDGDGFSLTLIKPTSNPIHADPFNWRSSVDTHGSPTVSDAMNFTDDPTDDEALFDYLLGDSGSLNARFETLAVDGVTANYLTLSVTVELAADDLSFVSEISYDLEAWQSNATLLSRTNNGDGSATLLFRSENPFTVEKDLYMRLRITTR